MQVPPLQAPVIATLTLHAQVSAHQELTYLPVP